MLRREERIDVVAKESKHTIRELERDRRTMERKERHLMQELRQYYKKGDRPKALILAKQIAHYRNTANKSFERSLFLEGDMLIKKSETKLAKAEMQHLKGMRFINIEDTPESTHQRSVKYQHLFFQSEAIENLMNETFDDIYNDMEELEDEPEYIDAEVNAILREAVDPKLKMRDYDKHANAASSVFENCRLQIRMDDKSAPMVIPTLEISVDMLKRMIFEDKFARKRLGLTDHHFRIGRMEDDLFVPFASVESLKQLGVQQGDSIFILFE
ncbi:hypothetical protein EDD86DRAFT_275923 [Gorgonomyces haynaldii]|nr:hypothetical protein EDD86DRAFT_275923 [Gorgonomyces haynaldii]